MNSNKLFAGIALALGIVFGVGWIAGAAFREKPPHAADSDNEAEEPLSQVVKRTKEHDQLMSSHPLQYHKLLMPVAELSQENTSPAPLADLTPAPKSVVDRPSKDKLAEALAHVLGDTAAQGPKPVGRFAVQIASYPKRDEAERSARGYQRRGYRVSVVQADLGNEKVVYRLRMQGYATRELAEAAQIEFEKKERLQTLVVAQ